MLLFKSGVNGDVIEIIIIRGEFSEKAPPIIFMNCKAVGAVMNAVSSSVPCMMKRCCQSSFANLFHAQHRAEQSANGNTLAAEMGN